MLKRFSLAIAAGLLGSLAVAQAQQADRARARAEGNVTQQPQLPDGMQMKELKQIDNIREQMANVTNYAMTRGDFGKVVNQLAVFNRDQMKDWRNQDFKTLDGVVAQINKDWNSKYGHDFKVKADVFDDRYMIVQGVVIDPNVAAMNFPVRARGQDAQLAGSRERARDANANNVKEGSQVEHVAAKDLQDSKNVATMHFPSEGTLPDLTASLVEEGMIGTWRFAVPKSMTSQQLHTQLQNELSYFGRDVSQWPANEADAYRLVAQRVVMALYNIDAPPNDRQRESK
ncbi:MAG TPA: hypothetical protein VIM11_12225 [Tepidisphaeraceae bacterium]